MTWGRRFVAVSMAAASGSSQPTSSRDKGGHVHPGLTDFNAIRVVEKPAHQFFHGLDAQSRRLRPG